MSKKYMRSSDTQQDTPEVLLYMFTSYNRYIHALWQGSVSGNDVHLLWMDESQHFPIVKYKMTRQQIPVSSRIL